MWDLRPSSPKNEKLNYFFPFYTTILKSVARLRTNVTGLADFNTSPFSINYKKNKV